MNKAVFNENSKWSKINTCLMYAITREYLLGSCQFTLLIHIITEYDRQVLTYCKGEIGVSLSYDDIAKKLNTSKDTAKQAAKKLIDLDLIKRINDRAGRAKYKYIPNVQLLKELMNNYLKDCPEDKE